MQWSRRLKLPELSSSRAAFACAPYRDVDRRNAIDGSRAFSDRVVILGGVSTTISQPDKRSDGGLRPHPSSKLPPSPLQSRPGALISPSNNIGGRSNPWADRQTPHTAPQS